MFNPDDMMESFSVIVTCEIVNPTSAAEYCEVFTERGNTTLIGKFTIGVAMYTYMHVYVCMYVINVYVTQCAYTVCAVLRDRD